MYKEKESLSCQISQYPEVLGAFNGLQHGVSTDQPQSQA